MRRRELILKAAREHKSMEELVQLVKAQRAQTRSRHKRETNHKLAERVDLSSETLRKGDLILREAENGNEFAQRMVEPLKEGKVSIDAVYRKLIGDERVGLCIKISPDLRQRVRDNAFLRDVSITELVAGILDEHLPK